MQRLLPLSLQRDFRGLHVGVFPLHLWTVHEVAKGVQSLRLPVEGSLLLVHGCPVPVLLGIEGLQVVHRSRHQVTWKRAGARWMPGGSADSPELQTERQAGLVFHLTSPMQTVEGRTGFWVLLIARLNFSWWFTWFGVTYPGCRQRPAGDVFLQRWWCQQHQAGPSQHHHKSWHAEPGSQLPT